MSVENQFSGFEYKEFKGDRQKISFYIDCYKCFGWEVDENIKDKSGELHLKRNRKIVNRMELTRLQRNFESCLKEIETLEKSKTTSATIASIATGLIGTAFITGSVFAVTSNPPHIIRCILLAIPGFSGWLAAWLINKPMIEKRTAVVTPLIDKKYDEIYDLCDKGSRLL